MLHFGFKDCVLYIIFAFVPQNAAVSGIDAGMDVYDDSAYGGSTNTPSVQTSASAGSRHRRNESTHQRRGHSAQQQADAEAESMRRLYLAGRGTALSPWFLESEDPYTIAIMHRLASDWTALIVAINIAFSTVRIHLCRPCVAGELPGYAFVPLYPFGECRDVNQTTSASWTSTRYKCWHAHAHAH